MFRRWARLIGREDLLDDPRLADDISRGNNATIINEAMAAWCAARTREQAIKELEEIEYPGGKKPVPIAATPVRLGEMNDSSLSRAPRLGEHTDEVLSEIGFSASEIAELRSNGAV